MIQVSLKEINLQSDRFFVIKKLLKDLHYDKSRRLSKAKINAANKDSQYRYRLKKQSRLQRQELMRSDPRFYEFFNWIIDLYERCKKADLVKNRPQFAKLVKVEDQTVKLWFYFKSGCGGHFPSDRAFKNLLRIEVILQSKVEVIRSKANIKSKKFPNSRIKIPRLRKRKQVSLNV